MSHASPRRGGRRPVGRLAGLAVLGGVLAVGGGVALVVGQGRPRWPEAVAFAASIAALGACGGWLAARWPLASPAGAVAGALSATLLRILPPLVGLAWLGTGGTELRRAGADGLLVFFYLATLATAVFLDIIGAPVEAPEPSASESAAGRSLPGN